MFNILLFIFIAHFFNFHYSKGCLLTLPVVSSYTEQYLHVSYEKITRCNDNVVTTDLFSIEIMMKEIKINLKVK